ncbi:protein tyrosine phosphatase family protein [Stenotrophomonas sp. YIM B06876]|uniref:protein tyrosine phosphatase family protein n=1 Tax=Stenotrophomonas sp. YIM B06876 TaxID=3060211 RepID=UPI0027398C27|nr:protein tyrosine phosphatase family protein [Stenotrophomonas sp. YIM B06876]
MIPFRLLALLLVLTYAPAFAAEPGFAQPRPGLYTAGQPSAEQLGAAAQNGITTVIDLRQPDEDRGFDEAAATRQLGLRYVRLPIAGAAGITEDNARALQQLLAQEKGPVLLHCASGNRVGALLALLNGRVEGAGIEPALQLGRRAGLTSLEPVTRALLERGTAE